MCMDVPSTSASSSTPSFTSIRGGGGGQLKVLFAYSAIRVARGGFCIYGPFELLIVCVCPSTRDMWVTQSYHAGIYATGCMLPQFIAQTHKHTTTLFDYY